MKEYTWLQRQRESIDQTEDDYAISFGDLADIIAHGTLGVMGITASGLGSVSRENAEIVVGNSLIGQVAATAGITYAEHMVRRWLCAGSSQMVRLIRPEEIHDYARSIQVPVSGLDIREKRLIEVYRQGYISRRVAAGMFNRLSDTNSLYYASERSPAYVVRGGKLYGAPAGSEAEVVGYCDSSDLQSERFEYLPHELSEAAVLYAAGRVLLTRIDEIATQLDKAPELAGLPPLPQLPTYQGQGVSIDYSPTMHRIDEDDVEVAATHLQKINAELNEFQANLSERLNQFNTQIQAWQSEVSQQLARPRTQSEIELSRIASDRQNALQKQYALWHKYRMVMQEFHSHISLYLTGQPIPVSQENMNVEA